MWSFIIFSVPLILWGKYNKKDEMAGILACIGKK
jgi:hypothetical protein